MSRERLRYTINITLALSLVATGGLSMWWLVHTKPQPATHSRADYATEVAVTLIQPQSTEVPIIGYGTVRTYIKRILARYPSCKRPRAALVDLYRGVSTSADSEVVDATNGD